MLHCCSAVVIMKGRAYVGVTSTGIFCCLTCGAGKPKSQNCQFFDGVSECLAAGFRACKRCRPLHRLDQIDPALTRLLDPLKAQLMHRWNEATLEQRGLIRPLSDALSNVTLVQRFCSWRAGAGCRWGCALWLLVTR